MRYLKKWIFKVIYLLFSFLFLLSNFNNVSAQDEAYQIGKKDVLKVSIYAGGELQQAIQVRVNEQGDINVPFVGSVKASGLTITELQQQIILPLEKDYFVNPEVNIYVEEYHSLQYYISGAVASPGLYKTRTKQTLLKLIAKAGGVSETRGNTAYILRDSADRVQEGEKPENLVDKTKAGPLKVNLEKLLDKGDLSENHLLKSGDVVYIPLEKGQDAAEYTIFVEGEVESPGAYPYRTGLTALNACLIAGGFGKFAAPNRTRIIRKVEGKQTVIKINLEKVREGKISDIKLKPGDLINIPETWF